MEVTTWYLEQTSADELRAAKPAAVPVAMARAEVVSPELNRYLYAAVGGDYYWLDRLGWTWQQWHDCLARPGVETWVASVRGTPCGYAELDGSRGGSVELVYFGLLPEFVGHGIGGELLTTALRAAWTLDERWNLPATRRVWVHTCSLDGAAAMRNYEARGMRHYRTERQTVELPAAPPGPWPGANRQRKRDSPQ
jgi:GNAT superfamily N-acetyltransferase